MSDHQDFRKPSKGPQGPPPASRGAAQGGHQTDQYRDLRIEQLGVELRLAQSQIRALKTKAAQLTETNANLRSEVLMLKGMGTG